MSAVQNVLEKLHDVRQRGDGYLARCPAHHDKKASLSVSEARDGKVLLHCHAGCSTEAVVQAVGLNMADLYPPKEPAKVDDGKPVAQYFYRDEEGRKLFVKNRYPGKRFLIRERFGRHSWRNGLSSDTPRVLYNLPTVIKRGRKEGVVFVEGEKDVDRLDELGFLATTNFDGAGGTWSKDYTKALRGCNVTIIPDEDEAGHEHAQEIAHALSGVAKRVKVLRLPGLEDGGDVSNWLNNGGTRRALKGLMKKCPEYKVRRRPKRAVPASKSDVAFGTDVGNGRFFARTYADRVRYCHGLEAWLVWDGQRWRQDATAEAEALAKRLCRRELRTTVDLEDEGRRDAALKHWRRSMHAARIQAMLAMASSERPIIVRLSELDANPWLLNCLNGTVNLSTGKLQDHNRADLITKLCPVEYDPDADKTLWLRFLRRVVPDKNMRAFLCRAVGYSLTGDTGEEQLFFISGPGATGKSTFVEAVRSALGEYGATSDFETFLKRNQTGGARGDLARLAGVRFVASVEVQEGKRLAEGLMKMLTGGDTVTARHLWKSEFEFVPQFKLWLAANHRPKASDDDTALWRRILLVPFEEVIPEAERDPQVKQRLRDPAVGGPAVLAWAVKGCAAWQRKRLGVPTIIKRATRAYRAENDPLADWMSERIDVVPGEDTAFRDLMADYLEWAKANGIRYPLSRKALANRLSAAGYDDVEHRKQHYRRGIALRARRAERGERTLRRRRRT